MKKLEEKLLEVLAGALEVSAFEQWLYANNELIELIDKDAFVFDVYAINYKDTNVLKSIELICLQINEPEAILITAIETDCRKLLLTENKETIEKITHSLSSQYDFNEPYGLLEEFYFLEEDFSLHDAGYNKHFDLLTETRKLVASTLVELENKSIEQKIEILIEGLPVREKPKLFVVKPTKPWYQFWKAKK